MSNNKDKKEKTGIKELRKKIHGLILEGFSAIWISYLLDCEIGQVREVAKREDLMIAKPLKPGSHDGNLAIDLIEAGCSVDEVAIVLEASPGQIREFLDRFGPAT